MEPHNSASFAHEQDLAMVVAKLSSDQVSEMFDHERLGEDLGKGLFPGVRGAYVEEVFVFNVIVQWTVVASFLVPKVVLVQKGVGFLNLPRTQYVLEHQIALKVEQVALLFCHVYTRVICRNFDTCKSGTPNWRTQPPVGVNI